MEEGSQKLGREGGIKGNKTEKTKKIEDGVGGGGRQKN